MFVEIIQRVVGFRGYDAQIPHHLVLYFVFFFFSRKGTMGWQRTMQRNSLPNPAPGSVQIWICSLLTILIPSRSIHFSWSVFFSCSRCVFKNREGGANFEKKRSIIHVYGLHIKLINVMFFQIFLSKY